MLTKNFIRLFILLLFLMVSGKADALSLGGGGSMCISDVNFLLPTSDWGESVYTDETSSFTTFRSKYQNALGCGNYHLYNEFDPGCSSGMDHRVQLCVEGSDNRWKCEKLKWCCSGPASSSYPASPYDIDGLSTQCWYTSYQKGSTYKSFTEGGKLVCKALYRGVLREYNTTDKACANMDCDTVDGSKLTKYDGSFACSECGLEGTKGNCTTPSSCTAPEVYNDVYDACIDPDTCGCGTYNGQQLYRTKDKSNASNVACCLPGEENINGTCQSCNPTTTSGQAPSANCGCN
ncbi:MAG: hypothetical protein N4A44_04760 [Alphaproteobacteria bacterium]|nr:hypothetical protein [Alphaproteobacteria bacterium]